MSTKPRKRRTQKRHSSVPARRTRRTTVKHSLPTRRRRRTVSDGTAMMNMVVPGLMALAGGALAVMVLPKVTLAQDAKTNAAIQAGVGVAAAAVAGKAGYAALGLGIAGGAGVVALPKVVPFLADMQVADMQVADWANRSVGDGEHDVFYRHQGAPPMYLRDGYAGRGLYYSDGTFAEPFEARAWGVAS